MSETAVVVIADIPEPKTGLGKNGKPWTRYAVRDGNGEFYSTFQPAVIEPAHGLKGKKAKLTFEQDGKFKNLLAVEPAETEAHEAIAARTDNGEADWDLIGLRKTRCHLLGAIYQSSAFTAALSIWTRAHTDATVEALGVFADKWVAERVRVAVAHMYYDELPAETDLTPF